jgi:hypothetical protein
VRLAHAGEAGQGRLVERTTQPKEALDVGRTLHGLALTNPVETHL